MVCTMLISVKL